MLVALSASPVQGEMGEVCIPQSLDCGGYDQVATCVVGAVGATSAVSTGIVALAEKAALGLDAGLVGASSAFLGGFGLACGIQDLSEAQAELHAILHSDMVTRLSQSWTQLHNTFWRVQLTGVLTSDETAFAWRNIANMTTDVGALQVSVQALVNRYSQAVRSSQGATGAGAAGAVVCTIAGVLTHGIGFLFCGIAAGGVGAGGGYEWAQNAEKRRRLEALLADFRILIANTRRFQHDIFCEPHTETCFARVGANITADALRLEQSLDRGDAGFHGVHFNITAAGAEHGSATTPVFELSSVPVVDSHERYFQLAQQGSILSLSLACIALSGRGLLARLSPARADANLDADHYLMIA